MLSWRDLCGDKRFQDLPYKVETTAAGVVRMTPTMYYHGGHAARIARRLGDLMGGGEVIVECAVETADGVKEADVAWLSDALADRMQDVAACPVAPEVCVEVVSPSNTEEEMMGKRDLFLGAGAREYWLCDREGEMRFFDASGQLAASAMCPGFPSRLPKRR